MKTMKDSNLGKQKPRGALPRLLGSLTAALMLSASGELAAQTTLQGLQVYLNFDNNILGQAGTTHNGVIHPSSGDPSAKYQAGMIGQAAAFNNNGSSGASPSDWAVSLGDIESLYAGSFSFSLWVNTTDTLGGFLGNKDWSSGGNIGWLISEYYSAFLNYRAVGGPRHDIGPAPRWADGTWHHVSTVFDRQANAVEVYLDGVQVAKDSLAVVGNESLTPAAIRTTLVGSSGNATYSASALIDDLGMWNRTLAPEEIAAIYAQGTNGLPLVTNSAPFWVQQPVGGTRYSSDAFKLSALLADDRGPVSFQWYQGTNKVIGATNSSLLLTNLTVGDYTYTLQANDGFGSLTSAPAALTVIAGSKITNGLAVYLNFDDNIAAQSPTTVNGTAVGANGSPVYGTGLIGSAAEFGNDASGSAVPTDWAVSLGDIENIYSNSWSFSLWVNLTNNLDGGLLGNKDWTSGSNIGWVFAPYNTTELNYLANGGPRRDLGGVNVRDGKWHQVASVFNRDLNTTFVYVDGNQVSASTIGVTGFESLTDGSLSPNDTLVGSSGPGAYAGAGAVDDLGIWSRSLTASEILAIYAQGLKGQPLTTAVGGSVVKPVITSQPGGETIFAGFGTSLKVSASGSAPLAFQWFKDKAVLTGQTNPTIVFPSASPADAGSYTVTVSNIVGSATSSNAVLTVIPPATSLTNGLVVYLDFEKSLLGKAGTTNNAVAIGTVGLETYTNGFVGAYAASFNNDGSSSDAPSDWAASLGDIEALYDTNFSFSVWIKTTDTLGAFLGNKDWSSGGNIGWLISDYYTTFLNYRAVDAPRYDVGPGTSWADNRWHHIACVFYRDINQVFTYVDGVLTSKSPVGVTGFESLTPTDIQTTLIGSSGNAAYSAFGLVDDLGMWARPLTQAEILAIYAAGQKGQGIPSVVLSGPSLSAKATVNGIAISYPAWASGYTVQGSPTLTPATWTAVTNAPVTSGGTTTVVAPFGTGSRYFRLIQ
jgi:Concanavalin A-like lectin/glucanases superfamily/Immunoglobulin domain